MMGIIRFSFVNRAFRSQHKWFIEKKKVFFLYAERAVNYVVEEEKKGWSKTKKSSTKRKEHWKDSLFASKLEYWAEMTKE